MYIIYSDSSRYSYGGRQVKVAWTSRDGIVEAARAEAFRHDEEWPAFDSLAAELDHACATLADDGRLFEAFWDADEFIERADDFGLRERAEELAGVGA